MTDRMKALLDEVLIEDAKVNTGDGAHIEIHKQIHDMRRWRAHEQAKAAQPQMQTECHADDFAALVKVLRAPITQMEQTPGGLDQLAKTVKECESEGSFPDLVFALARFYRKAWGENRWNGALGPIEAELKK